MGEGRRWFCDMDEVLVTGVFGSPFDTRAWSDAGRAIWAALEPLRPTLLSKVSDHRLALGYAQKRAWVDRELGRLVPLLVVPDSLGKAPYALRGDVLVDDDLVNCDEWLKSGGAAILHREVGATLAAIRALQGKP